MLKPSATELMKAKKIDSKYTLVIATAKRAREISAKKDNVFVECKSDKPVSIAVNEIAENKVTLKKAKDMPVSVTETTLNDILEQQELITDKETFDEGKVYDIILQSVATSAALQHTKHKRRIIL